MLKRIMIGTVVLGATVALAAPGDATPQAIGGGRGSHIRGGMRGGVLEMLGRNLYPPEMVLQNRTALALTDNQVTAIAKEIGNTHDKVQSTQDAVRAAVAELRALLEKPQVDEAAALAVASRAIDLEKQVKTAHLGMMIRVKNILTPDQQAKMQELRAARRGLGAGHGGAFGPGGPGGPEDMPPPAPADEEL